MGNCGEFCNFGIENNTKQVLRMRFTGNIDAKLDSKGRVFLPAAFRRILSGENEEGLVLRRDVFQKCLVLYPLSVWNKRVDAITERTNPFDRRGQENLRHWVAGSESISMDSDGRILIPKRYLEKAEIEAEVRFLGMDDTIEIWNRKKADELFEDDTDTFADSLEGMMGNVQ